MDSWATHASPSSVKFEDSPTESLLSTPGEMYPSLFGTDSSPAATVNPLEMLSPKSFSEEKQSDIAMLSSLTALTQPPAATATATATPEPEKKPVKKRKSWGQVLPEPKTNLPPRKRAKTEDEKEQRRVERVLRNRRAAQSSRERKRLEVEGLERRNKELERALHDAHQTNLALLEEIRKFQRSSGVVSRTSSAFEGLRQSPVTFSQTLFGSQDGHTPAIGDANSLEQLLKSIPSPTNTTVNPASLSPALSPIPETEEEQTTQPAAVATPLADATTPTANASPDATQHPAAMLCQDLQSTVAPSGGSAPPPPVPAGLSLGDSFGMPEANDTDRYVLESGLVATPNSSDFEYDHLAGDDSAAFQFTTNSYEFDFNEFITDGELNVAPSNEQQPQHLHSRNVADSSLLNPETPFSSEDPYLQPHSGASLDGCDDGGLAVPLAGGEPQQQQHRRGPTGTLPSKEVLLTLLWALKVEERRLQIRNQVKTSSKLGKPSVPQTTTPAVNKATYVLKVLPKRSLEAESPVSLGCPGPKRRRVQ
ncbi:Transcriptional activator hac1 [Madurella mycetomatis]|uniref:Transcriptional activator hac1 n=1 Tax=Madurella mycetomatis TaxID=100816 RepID=A0A175W5C4_9PEZI|nr:Transcriptional activator hac1 [Madurella mycetomatis]